MKHSMPTGSFPMASLDEFVVTTIDHTKQRISLDVWLALFDDGKDRPKYRFSGSNGNYNVIIIRCAKPTNYDVYYKNYEICFEPN